MKTNVVSLPASTAATPITATTASMPTTSTTPTTPITTSIPTTLTLSAPPSTPTASSITHVCPKALSDSELYKLCQFYGLNAKIWLRKFAGLLPEVFKRSLHRHRGCASIHEFAKKIAGMNEATVNKILNLYKRFQDKPALLALLLSGEQGWSKLEVVAFIATPENNQELAEKVANLPRSALVEYVEVTRGKIAAGGESANILQIPQVIQGFEPDQDMPVPSPRPSEESAGNDPMQHFESPPTSQVSHLPIFSIHLSEKSRKKLNHMKSMMEKRHRKTLTWDEVFKAWPITPQKTIIQTVCPDCAEKKASQTRPIPQAIQKLIFSTHGYTCAYPGCEEPYHELHHVYPWAKYKKHDPEQIYPLCKTHHALAHAGLIANMEQKPENWNLRQKPKQSAIDKKAMEHKNRT